MGDRAQVLIVDDEESMRKAMGAVVGRMGMAVVEADTAHDALLVLEQGRADAIVSDIKMPGMTGLELLATVQKSHPKVPVIMVTAYGTIAQAVDAMRCGAFDFITKPFSAEDLEGALQRALRPARRSPTKSPTKQSTVIITGDERCKRLLEVASLVAKSNANILIQGESGTGKELIAKLVHMSSPRADGPFVAINCAALPGNLLESELFGHEKGSFTGAVGTKIGKFEQAQGGTILLDEISEMESVLQAKLLRVLQEREVDRVGGTKPIPVDVRVLATTNRNLRQCVAEGTFREDLYYRLNVVPLCVPPLRERKGDVRLLIEHFVRASGGSCTKKIPATLLSRLEEYSWPGNVRELQNACERAILLSEGDDLQAEHFLLGALVSPPEEGTLVLHSGLTVAEAEKRLILETLKSTGNNKTRAAELLGISIRTLRNKLHEYGMAGPDEGN